MEKLISETSDSLRQQVGIELQSEYKHVDKLVADRDVCLNNLYQQYYNDPDNVIIAFGTRPLGEKIQYYLIGNWLAVIDDTYRRYIVMCELNETCNST